PPRYPLFPYTTLFRSTAMLENIEVFDPTIAQIDGQWWLFCARGELGASTWDELHVFYASTPFGPWTAHRRNPVKSDVRSARPAGDRKSTRLNSSHSQI